MFTFVLAMMSYVMPIDHDAKIMNAHQEKEIMLAGRPMRRLARIHRRRHRRS